MNAFKVSTAWAVMLRGALFLLFGLLTIFIASGSIYGPMFYLGILFVVTGLVYVVVALSLRKNNNAWFWWLLWGLADLCVGIYVLTKTERATDLFTLIIGCWAIIMGISLVIAALRNGHAKVMLLINAFVSLGFGFLILFNPFPTIMGLNFLIGLYAILFGLMVIYLGYQLKHFKRNPDGPGQQPELS